jgi:hypothetical protein
VINKTDFLFSTDNPSSPSDAILAAIASVNDVAVVRTYFVKNLTFFELEIRLFLKSKRLLLQVVQQFLHFVLPMPTYMTLLIISSINDNKR